MKKETYLVGGLVGLIGGNKGLLGITLFQEFHQKKQNKEDETLFHRPLVSLEKRRYFEVKDH